MACFCDRTTVKWGRQQQDKFPVTLSWRTSPRNNSFHIKSEVQPLLFTSVAPHCLQIVACLFFHRFLQWDAAAQKPVKLRNSSLCLTTTSDCQSLASCVGAHRMRESHRGLSSWTHHLTLLEVLGFALAHNWSPAASAPSEDIILPLASVSHMNSVWRRWIKTGK